MTPERWKKLTSEEIAHCRVFSVRRDVSIRENDPEDREGHSFYCIESPNWVNVIALTPKNEVVLIEQYRHGIEDMILEIPGGMIDEDELPEDAVRRELLEETGYTAAEIISLGKSHPNPAIQNNQMHHFLALGCEKTEEVSFDSHESIGTRLAPLSDVAELILNEQITHSLVLACFHKFELYLKTQTVSGRE